MTGVSVLPRKGLLPVIYISVVWHYLRAAQVSDQDEEIATETLGALQYG